MSFGVEVLAQPDLFPARRAGEAWGEGVVILELGGESLRVGGLSPKQESALRTRYDLLCLDELGGGSDRTSSVLEVFRADRRDFLPPTAPAEELVLELLHGETELRLASRDFMARVELTGAPAGALWTPADGDRTFLGAFENVARVLVAYRLLERGGILLHSSGVVDAGRAHLFVGRSGSGKTTVARLSRAAGKQVLSDDINVVAPSDDGSFVAERLPFAGELASPPGPAQRLPLAGAYLLQQGREHELAELPASRAVAGLLACSPFVNSDPHRLDLLLRNLERLVATTPVRVLTFRRDAGFWAKLGGGESG